MTYIKRKSARQEKRTSKEFGGKTQIASGAIETMKGDVRTGERVAGKFNENDFLIENKFTDAESYKLTLAVWNKIAKEAFRDNFRTPLMQIDIQDLEIVVMDEHLYSIYELESRPHSILKFSGKTATLKGAILGELLDDADVVALDFYNAKTKLYVTLKYEFLRLLS